MMSPTHGSQNLEKHYEPSSYVLFLDQSLKQREDLLTKYASSATSNANKRQIALAINATNHKLRSMINRISNLGYDVDTSLGLKISQMRFEDVPL